MPKTNLSKRFQYRFPSFRPVCALTVLLLISTGVKANYFTNKSELTCNNYIEHDVKEDRVEEFNFFLTNCQKKENNQNISFRTNPLIALNKFSPAKDQYAINYSNTIKSRPAINSGTVQMDDFLKIKSQYLERGKELNLIKLNYKFLILIGIFVILLLSCISLWQWKKRKTARIDEVFNTSDTNLEIEKTKTQLDELKNALDRKNHSINNLKLKIAKIRMGEDQNKTQIQKLKESLIITNTDVEDFINQFESVYPNFFDFIKPSFNSLTKNDKLIISMTILEINNKTQAQKIGISPRSLTVARYRLKAKCQEIADDSLPIFLEKKKTHFEQIYHELF